MRSKINVWVFSPQQKNTLNLVAISGLAAVVLAGCQPQSEAVANSPLLVEAVVAVRSDHPIRTVLSGEVQPETTVDVAFQVNGQVIERLVGVGDRVELGQPLARLGSTEQNVDISAAEASLETARAALVQAESQYERQKNLLDTGLTTRGTYDASVEAVVTARGRVVNAEANLQTASDALDRTLLKSYAGGTVTAREIEVGQVVQAGQTAFTIAVDGPREAVFNVDEAVLTDTFASQVFSVQVFGQQAPEFRGVLKEISPTIDRSTGTVKVTLLLDASANQPSLGSVVTTSAVFSATEAIVIPASALISALGQPAVWIVAPDTHQVVRRPVTVATFDNDSIAVTDGITANELVVTAGANLLYSSQVVAIKDQP